jgi:tetratricopeptide (TPR) repeat protein
MAMGGARRRTVRVSKAAALAAALLFGPFVCPPAGAQSADDGQTANPAEKATRATTPARSGKRPSPPSGADPAGAGAPRKPPKTLNLAKADPMALDASEAVQIDPRKLDGKIPNAWIALGLVELRGGNLGGAQASLERAMALGEQRRNKAAVAAAAIAMGRIHIGRLGFIGTEARNVAAFGSRPSDELTGGFRRELEGGKALFEKAISLHKALGRKDGMATAYALLGHLYSTAKDFDQAQAAMEEALALNKALRRRKEMAANYQDLAETHRYDLDEAEALLKEAATLHEALGLKEELAEDYEKLAANNVSRGEPYEAERLYKLALPLASKYSQSGILRALERLYRDRNDPGQAAEMEEQARALAKEREKGGGGRMILFSSSLGLYVSVAITKIQLEALEKVVPMEKKLSHWPGLATTYVLLGLHYGQRAEIDTDRRAEFEGRAEAVLREAVALNATLGREPALANAYRELALILNRRGNIAEVQVALKEATALNKKLGDEDDTARLYFLLGRGSKDRGDSAQACAYWRSGAVEYPGDRSLVDALNLNKCAATQ